MSRGELNNRGSEQNLYPQQWGAIGAGLAGANRVLECDRPPHCDIYPQRGLSDLTRPREYAQRPDCVPSPLWLVAWGPDDEAVAVAGSTADIPGVPSGPADRARAVRSSCCTTERTASSRALVSVAEAVSAASSPTCRAPDAEGLVVPS